MIQGLMALLLSLADDAEIAGKLREMGVKVVEAKGTVTSIEVGDCSKWTDEDFKRVAQLSHLRSLSFGPGLKDASVPLLAGLPELDSLQTNLALISDDGVKAFAAFKSLKVLKFFHPCKEFTGTGLAALAEMPSLERLTVAGSLAFADDGMAAVGKLTRLKEFRTWHAGQTLEGVKHLKGLTNLKNLTLGQRLAYKPPTTLSDETLGVLAELKSLETLQLEEARLKRESLSLLKGLPELKKLTLEGIDIADADVEQLRGELPKVEIKWTKPSEIYLKRINALFGPR
ncbi:MAG: hypothetical protein HY293_16255 [Planctomycetes bacterium]|nr:hypothetical protein [Planctomycetota bacterium]